MDQGQTTIAVQRYLDELACVESDLSAEAVVRELLTRAVDRLHLICARLLYQNYPRLTRGPTNLRSEELLGAVVERMIKAMRGVRPQTVRQFFALANQHMRWELNDLARRLDREERSIELRDSFHAQAPSQTGSSADAPNVRRILEAIDKLPDDEREAFHLVRLQGMSKTEAAGVIGVTVKTVHRRVNRSLLLLGRLLGDLQLPPPDAPQAPTAS